jgi:hypothetical protein
MTGATGREKHPMLVFKRSFWLPKEARLQKKKKVKGDQSRSLQ